MRLLLVEDDDSNRITLSALLEDERFEVDAAMSIEEAEAFLRARQDYGAVLLDLQVGKRSGTELVPSIRRASPAIRILLHSGSRTTDEPVPAVDAVLAKTGDFDVLLECLASLGCRPDTG